MTSRPRRWLAVCAFACAAGALAPASAAPGTTTRASVGSTETQADGASPATSVQDTTSPQISLDGLAIAFSSDATNLVSGDTNGAADVFVRTLVTGRTGRVSVSSSERQGNGASHSPALSVDGRHVAFVSDADNLVAGDDNDLSDAFLHDTKNGRTTRLMPPVDELPPMDLNGTPVDDPRGLTRRTWTSSPSISYDGRYVAVARGTYDRAPASPSSLEVFVLDRTRKRWERIPAAVWSIPGVGAARGLADHPMISADGRYVVYETWTVMDSFVGSSESLVRNPVDHKDIVIWDRAVKAGGLVSSSTWGIPGNGDSTNPSVSASGHHITFTSAATNLVAGDTNDAPDVFVRDNVTRTTSRVTTSSGAVEAPAGGARSSISYEGRNIAFATAAANMVGGDTNGVSDVFLRDRRTDTLNRPPKLSSIAERGLNQLEEYSMRLRARDPERDPVRYGIIFVKQPNGGQRDSLPPGARLDPQTGEFHWFPTPDQAGQWQFVFRADDPRGFSDFRIWKAAVRTPGQSIECTISRC